MDMFSEKKDSYVKASIFFLDHIEHLIMELGEILWCLFLFYSGENVTLFFEFHLFFRKLL